MTHNYAVYEQIWKRTRLWKKKVVVEMVELIDGYSDPYDADCMAEQIRKDNPKSDIITYEKDDDDDDFEDFY